MDREQEEMQFLGLFGMYKESIKIIFTWRKIFSKITLSLILPLTFIFLAHIKISHILLRKIWHNEYEEYNAAKGSRRFNHLSDIVRSEWTLYWLLKAAYLTFFLVFSLLSTAAVVYTIASIYTGCDVTFRKVMTVVPKVWKRLMITFLCAFFAFFIYNFVAYMLVMIFFMMFPGIGGFLDTVFFHILLLAYVVGFVYMTIIWQMASVVSVLESSYGVKAVLKSKDLIKGNKWAAIIIFFSLNFCFVFIQQLFESYVVYGHSKAPLMRVGLGILCFLLLFKFFLFGLVIQTVLYLVCKSYHHENIDKSSLSDHLESYMGDYEPLSGKDVQLEQYDI